MPEKADEDALRLEILPLLGAGEASCLALAVSRNLVLATDDKAARRMAIRRNVRLIGTVGILAKLVKEGQLSLKEGNEILQAMRKRRYRSPVERLDDLI